MSPTGASPTHVLIVDDEPHICALIREELSERGFSCQAVTKPQQAKELLDSRRFDLLILDILMPRVSGLGLLAYARRHVPDCKVILITANSRRQYLAQALALGAYDYIEKPFRSGELAEAALRAVLYLLLFPPPKDTGKSGRKIHPVTGQCPSIVSGGGKHDREALAEVRDRPET